MIDNICCFVPYHKDCQSIHTVNFVLESNPLIYGSRLTSATYRVHYIAAGTGFLHIAGRVKPLSAGDVFFTFPGETFSIEAQPGFSYMYVSYLGTRANMIMEKLKISGSNFHFPDCGEIGPFWNDAFHIHQELTDLISESVLLYTFAFIGNKLLEFSEKPNNTENAYLRVKQYLDDHFTDPELSLQTISRALAYNPKYISGIFKSRMGIGMAEYVNIIRIQYACTLIRQGFGSVNEIAKLSGYADASYFSKVFKKKMSLSPREYILSEGAKSGK